MLGDPDAVARASIALKHFVTPMATVADRNAFRLAAYPGLAPHRDTDADTTDEANGAGDAAEARPTGGSDDASRSDGSDTDSDSDASSSSESRRPSVAVVVAKRPPRFLRHSTAPRMEPLTLVPAQLRTPALMLSRNLLGAMGDRSFSFQSRLASTVRGWLRCPSGHTLCLPALTPLPPRAQFIITAQSLAPELRDEAFMLLCAQLTENENPASRGAGWELLKRCLTQFPPSDQFERWVGACMTARPTCCCRVLLTPCVLCCGRRHAVTPTAQLP